MKPIRLTDGLREQAIERGTNPEEIIDTMIASNRQPAKNSLFLLPIASGDARTSFSQRGRSLMVY